MAGPNHTIEVSWELMSSGKYARNGDDLEITYQDLWGETERVLLESYFSDPKDLVTPNGSILKSHIVNLLAVNSQPLDQTLVAFEDPDAIGEITIAAGTVTVQRAGQTLELQVGDLIYLNDVVESAGGSTGIVFKDDTTLSVDAGARMVIDDFVYDPEQPTTGSMSVNMLSGDFSFISGGVAKTGADAMKVTTPVLTIGVRGTQVAGKASQEGESNEVVLLPNEDGTVGEVALITQAGEVVLTQAFESSTITSAFLPPSIPVIVPEDIVLKKFAKTIATNKTTLKTSKKNKQSKEAEKEKKKLEEEKEELEQEKEQLEKEAEQLEEEKAELEEKLADEDITEEEKAQLEEELAAVEEKVVAVEEKVEQVVEQAEQVEQKFEQVEQQIQQIEKEFEQFFEEIKEEFGEEVVAEVEQAVAEAEKVFEEKIQEEVAKEVEAEIKEEEKIEDPFEEAPEEEMDQQMDQNVEEEIQQLEEEIQQLEEEPIVEEAIEEDIFKDDGMMTEEDKMEEVKIEEEIKEFETELAKEEPVMDNNFVAFEEGVYDEPVDDYVVEQFEPAPQIDVMEEEFVYEEPEQEEQQDAEPVDYAPTASADAVTVSETISDGASVATVTGDDAGGDTLTYSIVSGNDGGLFQIDASTGEITYVKDVTQLATEDFENLSDDATPTGWQGSQAKIKNTTYDTGVLGRIGNDTSGDQLVYKTFDVGTQYANKRIKIDFTFHEYGSWDADQWGNTDEYFRAWVNDDMKINDLRHGGQSNHDMKYGSKVGGSKKGWNKIKKNEGMAVINNYQESDQYSMYGKVQNDGTVKIGFGAILAESINNESFSVDNIKVRLAGLDYEDVNQHTLTVRVSDGNQYVEVDQVINVSDGNDAPIFDEGRSAISIAENGSSGEQVQVVKATDADDDTMTYSIIDGNTGNKFAIDSSTGIITTTGALDYETTSSYTLTIKAEDPGGASATTTQVVNVSDVDETTQYTKTMDSGTLAAWGALYSQDMNINNAWADDKIAYVGSNSNYHGGSGTIWHNLGYSYNGISSYDWKTLSQYEQIWDFNYSSTIFNTQKSAMLDYLKTGGQAVGIFEHGTITGNHAAMANFVKDIDSDISSSLSTTDIINGHSTTDGGNGSNGSFNSTTELHTIAAEYNVSDWGKFGAQEGTESKNVSDTITRGDGVAAAGAWHAENLGSGDLITVQTRTADGTKQGFIAEWDANDSDAQYQGTFVGWGDSNHSYNGNDMRQAYDVVEWLALQAEGQTHGVTTDNEILPIFGSADGQITITDQTNDALAVEAYHLGDDVYVGGGFNYIDWAWDDSADTPYWAFNKDLDTDGNNPFDIRDDHYGVIGFDADGDGDLWETTDTFSLDKIKILDDSKDYFVQDVDATGPIWDGSGGYYFKVTPVTYSGGSWTVETSNTVTVTNTTDYNAYLDLSANTAFDNINYALIETESALISEVVVSG